MFERIRIRRFARLNRRFRFALVASSSPSADGSGDDAAGRHGAGTSGAARSSAGAFSAFRRFADRRSNVPEEDDLIRGAGHDLATAQSGILQRRPEFGHFEMVGKPLKIGDAGLVTLLDGGDGGVANQWTLQTVQA